MFKRICIGWVESHGHDYSFIFSSSPSWLDDCGWGLCSLCSFHHLSNKHTVPPLPASPKYVIQSTCMGRLLGARRGLGAEATEVIRQDACLPRAAHGIHSFIPHKCALSEYPQCAEHCACKDQKDRSGAGVFK